MVVCFVYGCMLRNGCRFVCGCMFCIWLYVLYIVVRFVYDCMFCNGCIFCIWLYVLYMAVCYGMVVGLYTVV